ncbi:MAG: zinc-binding dehydrogenase [Nitriliruptoraceae bacterium]
MRALRLHRVDGPPDERLRIDDVGPPAPGDDLVVVDVHACGLCGEDLHLLDGRPDVALPRTLGHEASGVVAQLGSRVDDWQPGDRVAIVPRRSCGICGHCRSGRPNLCATRQRLGFDVDGGLAEQVAVAPEMLVPVPVEMDLAQAAVTTHAAAVAWHALKRAGIGEDVVIAVHGVGGVGLHAVQLAVLAGARVVAIDVDRNNLQRARALGADEVVDAREGEVARRVRDVTSGGVDRALEMAGTAQAVGDAIASLHRGGRLVLVGTVATPTSGLGGAHVIDDELEIVGSSGSTPQDVGELFDLVADGRLDLSGSVTARIGLDDVGTALQDLRTRGSSPTRIVVTPR